MNPSGGSETKIISDFSIENNKIECSISANTSDTVKLTFKGKNSLLVPINDETLSFSVFNQTHLLYNSKNVKFSNKIIPYNKSLLISRFNPTVGEQTTMLLEGSLPDYDL